MLANAKIIAEVAAEISNHGLGPLVVGSGNDREEWRTAAEP